MEKELGNQKTCSSFTWNSRWLNHPLSTNWMKVQKYSTRIISGASYLLDNAGQYMNSESNGTPKLAFEHQLCWLAPKRCFSKRKSTWMGKTGCIHSSTKATKSSASNVSKTTVPISCLRISKTKISNSKLSWHQVGSKSIYLTMIKAQLDIYCSNQSSPQI